MKAPISVNYSKSPVFPRYRMLEYGKDQWPKISNHNPSPVKLERATSLNGRFGEA